MTRLRPSLAGICVPTAIFACCVCVRGEDAKQVQPAIASWEALDSECQAVIRDQGLAGLTYETLLQSPAFLRAAKQGGRQLWWEMTEQSERPLVAIAGFRCLEHSAREDAFLAALTVLARRSRDASLQLYYPVLEYLEANEQWAGAEMAALTDLVRSRPPVEQFAMLVIMLPKEFLYAWFHEPHDRPLPSAHEAYVLDSLYATNERPITDAMKARLEEFAEIPGIPRLIFVSRTARRDDFFAERAVRVIEDTELTDVSVALFLRGHAELVQSIDLDNLQLSEERRGLINQALKQADD